MTDRDWESVAKEELSGRLAAESRAQALEARLAMAVEALEASHGYFLAYKDCDDTRILDFNRAALSATTADAQSWLEARVNAAVLYTLKSVVQAINDPRLDELVGPALKQFETDYAPTLKP